MDMALQAMDDVIASLLDGIHHEGLSSCINMILLADHGKGRSCVYMYVQCSELCICFLEMLTYRQKLLTINTTCVHVHVHVNVLSFVL